MLPFPNHPGVTRSSHCPPLTVRRGLRPPPPYPTRCPCGCAAPQRDEHKVVPRRATPSQPLPPGGGVGKPGFPTPLLEGCALPIPPASGGAGKPGFPTPLLEGQALLRAGVWGNLVPPCSRSIDQPPPGAYNTSVTEKGTGGLRPRGEKWDNLVVSPPCGSAAQRRDAHTVVPGRATPSQPLPRVGVWRNPVSPDPCARAAPSHPRPRVGAWGNPVSPPSWSLFSR